MSGIDMIRTFIEYHVDMSRRVWESIDQISDEQFIAQESYSRGSIRNLMVHLSHTDLRWLTGLKNLPDPGAGMKTYEEYPDRVSVREYWESVAAELTGYVSRLDDAELNENPVDIPGPRWEVLLHLVNHGTDHRSTVLQKLQSYGAPTFDQDFIMWVAQKAT
jgi:uncharacterized damage-inducible protein DinB